MKKNLIVLLGLITIFLCGCGNKGGADAATEKDPFAAGNVYEMYYKDNKDPSYQFEFLEDERVSLDELEDRKPIKFDYSLSQEEGYDIQIITFEASQGVNMGAFHKDNPYYYVVSGGNVYLVDKGAYSRKVDPDGTKLKELEDQDTLISRAHKIMKLKE